MPRELRAAAALAMAPAASEDAASFRSLLRLVMMPNLEAKVTLACVIWVILRQLQSVLGPRRRHSRHWLVQYGAMGAYYLPTLIAFYTANAVYSSPSGLKVALSMVCSGLLFSCARGAVTMTAFTLDHNGPARARLQSWRLLPWLLYFAWLQWGSIWLDRRPTVLDVYSFTVVFIFPVLYVLLAKPSSAILDQEAREFACYMNMMRESRTPSPFFHGDADSLYDGCRYPFAQLTDGGWIDFSDVLKLRGRLPRDCAVDPDICLSYSFCRLLARRYFGFPCAEDGDAQVRDLVLTELLADCDRGFTIVEVQLALLHDYFFTNYHSEIASGLVSFKQGMAVFLFVSLLFLGGYFSGFLIKAKRESNAVFLCAFAVPALLMYIVIRQPEFSVLPRHWHPIQNLFVNYAEAMAASPSGPSVTDQSAAPHPRSQSSKPPYYWRHKMGQYSLIEDYDHRSRKKAIIAWCKVHVLSQTSYSFVQHHPAEEEDVSVPDSLRRFVAGTIRDLNGPPAAIGAWSLSVDRDNSRAQLDDLSWTCRQETLTHTILIWHIATSYCDMADMSSQQPPEEETPHQPLSSGLQDMSSQPLEEPSTGYREVATTLSRYCAYMVAFLPELLPEHNLTAKVVLQQVLQEPRHLLGTSSRMSMEAKRTRIQELQLPKDDPTSLTTTFEKGVWLGRQLDEQLQDVSLRWKAMADFWAETILYIAASSSSSDKAAAHIELLAQGGEFVTHLWALLCNAGIVNLKRAREQWTPHQATA